MLLTYAQIETALLRRFAHVIDDDEILDLHDLLLIPHLLDPADNITEFEQAMGVVLPTSLREFLRLYQVDDFAMANVQFGQGEAYLHHVFAMNHADALCPWWQGKMRPVNLLLVAVTDGYVLILDVYTGAVWALDQENSAMGLVAHDFEDFFRALATVYLSDVGLDEVLAQLKVEPSGFWEQQGRLKAWMCLQSGL